MRKSCFLFGHRDCPDSILPKIEATVKKHYELGVRWFYVGHRGRFDSLVTTAVKRVKEQYPDIRLYLVISYHPAERAVDLWPGFDNSFYPPLEGVPRQYAIVKANEYMVDTTDTAICYVSHFGNTRKLLERAQRRQRKGEIIIENLAEDC